MNIVRIDGATGTQMFQYALAEALRCNGTTVKIDRRCDTSCIDTAFDLRLDAATPDEVKSLADVSSSALARLRRMMIGESRDARGTLVKEYCLPYSRDIATCDNHYVWCEMAEYQYYEHAEKAIDRLFVFKTAMPQQYAEVADEIGMCESVAVHFSACPGVSSKAEQLIAAGICTPNYYEWAAASMRQQLAGEEVRFFVFTDNIALARNSVKINDATFIESRGLDTMRLMAQCRHCIISNSAEAWWGARLCSNPDKIVIAPEKWRTGIATPGIYPHFWLQIPI